MRLSKKAAIRNHRLLWDWLYRHPSLRNKKDNWPGWKRNGGKYPYITQDCFLCEYDDCCMCRKCPLKWPGTYEAPCCGSNGLFEKWNDSETWQSRKKYAKLIRDLPERK